MPDSTWGFWYWSDMLLLPFCNIFLLVFFFVTSQTGALQQNRQTRQFPWGVSWKRAPMDGWWQAKTPLNCLTAMFKALEWPALKVEGSIYVISQEKKTSLCIIITVHGGPGPFCLGPLESLETPLISGPYWLEIEDSTFSLDVRRKCW